MNLQNNTDQKSHKSNFCPDSTAVICVSCQSQLSWRERPWRGKEEVQTGFWFKNMMSQQNLGQAEGVMTHAEVSELANLSCNEGALFKFEMKSWIVVSFVFGKRVNQKFFLRQTWRSSYLQSPQSASERLVSRFTPFHNVLLGWMWMCSPQRSRCL